MGRLSHAPVRPLDRNRQASRSVVRGGGRTMVVFYGELCPEGGGTGGKEGVWEGPNLQRDGDRH